MEITDDQTTSPAFGGGPSSGADGASESAPSESGRSGPDEEAGAASDSGVVHICKRCMTSRSESGSECPECGDTLLPIRSTCDSYLGETVGEKYKLVEQIGSGGMGEVYLGVNEPLDQRVAVKFLSEQYAANEQVIMRFLNEARSYCRVAHPNAVTLLDYGQHGDGSLYIITEYVEGVSLTDAIEDHGALTPQQATSIVMQCCEVLSTAHEQGVIHRDLKPDNLMLIPEGRDRYAVKVLDFGIAKIVDDDGPALTETGAVFGTPEFMSPEQAEGKPADPRSDVYALGIILFYAATARLPFDGESQYSVLEKQIHDAPPKASSVREDVDVPPELETIIERCLRKEREARYESAEALYEALEAARGELSATRSPGESRSREGEGSEESANIELTEIIEDSAEVHTRGYPAGEPSIDSRAETADGAGPGLIDPDRFQVGERLRSVDLSREEPREEGLTLPDSRPDPLRRFGVAVAAVLVAGLVGWQVWSSLEPASAGAGDENSVPAIEREARRTLSAANAALDGADHETAGERIQRAAAAVPSKRRSEYLVDLLETTRERRRAIERRAAEFERAVGANECDRASRIGRKLITDAPEASGRVARRLNDCASARAEDEGSADEPADRAAPSAPEPEREEAAESRESSKSAEDSAPDDGASPEDPGEEPPAREGGDGSDEGARAAEEEDGDSGGSGGAPDDRGGESAGAPPPPEEKPGAEGSANAETSSADESGGSGDAEPAAGAPEENRDEESKPESDPGAEKGAGETSADERTGEEKKDKGPESDVPDGMALPPSKL